MNILILAAGQTPSTPGEDYPLCLTEFDGTPLIERVITACHPLAPRRIVVALRADEVRRFHLDGVVKLLAENSVVISVREKTHGAACTALLAAAHIDNDEPLLIVNGNDLIDVDFRAIVDGFTRRGLDAGTITFDSVHPRYSYVRLQGEFVVEAAEKNPISRLATAGVYWFARGNDFVGAAKEMIRKDASVNGAYYICPTFNELVLAQKKIGVAPIEKTAYHPLKTGRQVDRFEATLERT